MSNLIESTKNVLLEGRLTKESISHIDKLLTIFEPGSGTYAQEVSKKKGDGAVEKIEDDLYEIIEMLENLGEAIESLDRRFNL